MATTLEELVQMATDPASDFDSPGTLQQDVPGQPILAPSFENGGLVTAPPAPVAGVNPAGVSTPVPPQQIQAEVQRMAQEHPEQVAKIAEIIQLAVQQGELTLQELNLAGQLAQASIQNPELTPKLVDFAVQQGLINQGDLSGEPDPGLAFVILMAVEAVKGMAPQAQGQPPVAGPAQAQGQPPISGFRAGGSVPSSRNTDGSVSIVAHEGEMVMNADAVRRKGTEFFKKLNEPPNAKKT